MSLAEEESLQLSFLDLLCFATLKEVLTNTAGSKQAEYLTNKCPRIMTFIKTMEIIMDAERTIVTSNKIGVKSFGECARICNQV